MVYDNKEELDGPLEVQNDNLVSTFNADDTLHRPPSTSLPQVSATKELPTVSAQTPLLEAAFRVGNPQTSAMESMKVQGNVNPDPGRENLTDHEFFGDATAMHKAKTNDVDSSYFAHVASAVAAETILPPTAATRIIDDTNESKKHRPSILQPFPKRSELDAKVVSLKHYSLHKTSMEEKRNHSPRVLKSPRLFFQSDLDSSGTTQKTRTRPMSHLAAQATSSAPTSNHPDLFDKDIKNYKHDTGTSSHRRSIEEMEDQARQKATDNPLKLLFLGNWAALKITFIYFVTLETLVACGLTVGLTLYWYLYAISPDGIGYDASKFNFVLLTFAVTSPIVAALGMAFTRRERALMTIADFRSFSHHLYLAHSLWDWTDKGGRAGAAENMGVNWVEHCDAVMAQLVGIGDELSRFLTLPSASRSRHKFTRQGRKEASLIMEASYHLLESMSTQRMSRLIYYSERLKKIGLPSGEISRLRQYERWMSNNIEQLRVIKMYRTPMALRAFARLLTIFLPPFYAPYYAQVAINVGSLGVGIAFGVVAVFGLTGLFESLQVLEDPFITYLALDGIDVREELEVLHFAQLVNTRKLVFPEAPPYPPGRRCALTGDIQSSKKHYKIGYPPVQNYHDRRQHQSRHSRAQSLVSSVGVHSPAGEDVDFGITLSNLGSDSGDQAVGSASGPPSIVECDMHHIDLELGSLMMEEDAATVREPAFAAAEDHFHISLPIGNSERSGRSHRTLHRRAGSATRDPVFNYGADAPASIPIGNSERSARSHRSTRSHRRVGSVE